MKLKEIIKEAQDSLAKLSQQLNSIEIEEIDKFQIQSYKFYEFQDKSKLNSITANFSPPYIYTIEIADCTIIKELVEKYHNRPQGLKISKFNYKDREIPLQNTLYVGSTMKDLKKRLKQHLGLIDKNVYGMHLSRWDEQMAYTLTMTIYHVENKNCKITKNYQNLVEIIEQQMWENLKPVFGKKSGQL